MQCHECGATISDKAADCPHCGASVSPPAEGGSERGGGRSSDGVDEPVAGGADVDDSTGDSAPDPGEPPTGDRDEDRLDTGRPGSDPSGGHRPDEQGAADERPTGGQSTGGQEPVDQGPGGQEPVDQEPVDQEPVDQGPGGQDSDGQGEGPVNQRQGGGQQPRGAGQQPGGPPQSGGPGGQSGGPGGHPSGQGGERPDGSGGFADDLGERLSDLDPVGVLRALPLFPGAAAGFAVGVVVFGVAVAFRAAVPVGDVTLADSATALFDLHFATEYHVTPSVYNRFEVARPPNASLGFLYLVPMILLYTAAKGVVAFNTDEETTLPVAVLSGTTVVLGYVPVMLVALVLTDSFSPVTLLGALAVAALFYPLVFGALGGLMGGSFTGSERRVSTVYALGALFALFVGSFVTSFLFVSNPSPGFDLVSRLFVTLFAMMGTTAFTLGGGSAANVLPFLVAIAAFAAAGFVRVWRAGPDTSPLRGFTKGASMWVTYAVVAGFFVSVLAILEDDYTQTEVLDMSFEATSMVDGIVFTSLSGIGPFVWAVVGATVVYAVVTPGLAGLVAAAIRSGTSGDATEATEAPA